ncbi:ABC-2 [Sulfurimonas gotlandica GD1]|nr:ABC-2 [Sulfurimonas gotlandica GD1]
MIKKELLLVLRDRHALLALFVMPAIFILIMSVAMKNQFSTNELEFSLYINNIENSKLSQELISKIQEDKNILLVTDKENAQFLLEIPKDYSPNTTTALKLMVKDALKSNQIEIFKSLLSKHILNIKFGMFGELGELFEVKYNNNEAIPNSTQQSVPAWIVFGMFFIIIPMSTIYINERKQNTLSRLNSMNVSILSMTLSKSIPYLAINQIQVWIMLGVGIFLVPLFDTPALEINGSIGAIIAISLALSVSAIGVSSLIAVSASSSEQATTIGGILNILLGAIGGVMVPKYIMPESMQRIADFSPMSWGLDGFLDIFLKAADASMIIKDVAMLFTFGLIALIASMIILQQRINKGL